jgi:hypothetical protein
MKNKLFVVNVMDAKGKQAQVILAAPKPQAAIEQVKEMDVFNGCVFHAAEAAPILLVDGKNDRYTVLIHGGKFKAKFVADKNPM